MRPLYDAASQISADSIHSISINIASPEQILKWSKGEVTTADTIHYKSQKPVKNGLFCQKIFGPLRDYECACGLYKRKSAAGKVCEKCGVSVTAASVRRERMGHIELATPVAHIWYARGVGAYISKLLNIKQKDVEDILSFSKYIVTDPGIDTDLKKCQILTDSDYWLAYEKYETDFKAAKGAEALKELLEAINLDELEAELVTAIANTNSQTNKQKIGQRLQLVRKFKESGNRPEWMILTVLPVIPPDLRPMTQMDSGNYASSDINELYKRVILRNNRLRSMIEKNAPAVILDNEKRMLQQSVDCLLDNAKVKDSLKAQGPNKRQLKSLSEALAGKTGRFRQNLLGKRVDYSGRSVICVDPTLKIYQCGLPKALALELFKPFVAYELIQMCENLRAKAASKMIDRQDERVWDALDKVIADHPVFLNRAPTLHRLGIQAFQPVLVEGNAIKLHPLVCTAFNADFDGDQMAVHLPLSAEAQAEARFLMLSANNLLKPAIGKPVAVPSQDMVLGAYYLTTVKDGEKGEGKIFCNKEEAEMAYANKAITLQSKIKVRQVAEFEGEKVSKVIDTTLGRLIFNSIIPQDLGFVDRTKAENACELEINFLVKKEHLAKIVERCIEQHDMARTAEILDDMKTLGYKYATLSGITVSVSDATIPEEKATIVDNAHERVARLQYFYNRGFVSADERSRLFISIWNTATDKVTGALEASFDIKHNPIHIMADSGARGSTAQIRQLAGMRGLVANTSGKTIEMPIIANYREGLNVLEYFISARGARKGLADTALRTADSGYFTRRLVDVAQGAVITEHDCGCHDGIEISAMTTGKEGVVIEPLEERLVGRYLVDPYISEDKTVQIGNNTLITKEIAHSIVASGCKSIKVRSALTCESQKGICAKCYGLDLATNKLVNVGTAVGVMSAQSIGEPGTQLTMRTFHTGGIASNEDITQGLPRVINIFENYQPKDTDGIATIAMRDGVVSIQHDKYTELVITDSKGESEKHCLPYNVKPIVNDGQWVAKGQFCTTGIAQPSVVLAIAGVEAARNYVITEVQKVYRQQGVDINDKHIEVILRYLMSKVVITDPGSLRSKLTVGTQMEATVVHKLNKALEDKQRAGVKDIALVQYAPVLMGLTKTGTHCDSFLSAASFQETTRVLTDAAVSGKVDYLTGLKENVMIGRLIPAGTGIIDYDNIKVVPASETQNMA